MTLTQPKPIAKPTEPQQKRARWWHLGAAVWLIIWLACIDVTLSVLKPLKYVTMPTMIFADQDDPIDIKIPAFLSQQNDANVFMLGSSLAWALSRADDLHEPDIGTISSVKAQLKAPTFDKVLSNNLHFNAKAINMGIDACMVIEDRVLLEEALKNGKHPKLLFVFLAPRDFISNTYKPNFHVTRWLSDHRPFWEQIDWVNPMKTLDKVASKSSLYRNYGNFRRVIELASIGWMHRAPNLYYAGQGEEYWKGYRGPKFTFLAQKDEAPSAAPSKEDNIKKLTEYYKHDYLPVNYKLMADQFGELGRLLDDAAKAKIPTVVVNMPRGKENEELLPQDFVETYRSTLASACASSGAKFVDFEADETNFGPDDYYDAVHLDTNGARKFFNLLTQRIKDDKQFANKLP